MPQTLVFIFALVLFLLTFASRLQKFSRSAQVSNELLGAFDMGAFGCFWVLLGAFGCFWVLLIWVLLGALGCSWVSRAKVQILQNNKRRGTDPSKTRPLYHQQRLD
jgi:uncharacterized membrane protein